MVNQHLELGLNVTGTKKPLRNYETDPHLIKQADFFGNSYEEVMQISDDMDFERRENEYADFFFQKEVYEVITDLDGFPLEGVPLNETFYSEHSEYLSLILEKERLTARLGELEEKLNGLDYL